MLRNITRMIYCERFLPVIGRFNIAETLISQLGL